MIQSSKKTSARGRIVKECDGLVKQIVFARDGFKCMKCGRGAEETVLHPAHVFPKGKYQRMRFMPVNVLCLCLADHLYWAHKDPIGFTEWFREKYPERYTGLILWTRQAPKLDLKQIRIELQEELKGMQ